MFLWTAQTIETYDTLIHTGVYRCDTSKITDFEWWKPAYDWMVKEMRERIGSPPEGVKYPIWLWYRWNGHNKKPDLRARRSFGSKGTELVLIEIEIPDNQVVLSDFDNWHSVLNHSYSYSEAQSEKEFDKIHEWIQSLSPSQRQLEIQKSWESIFDISVWDNDFSRNGIWVQATIWELRKEHIRKNYSFIC